MVPLLTGVFRTESFSVALSIDELAEICKRESGLCSGIPSLLQKNSIT
jgi:hypothetical protein